MKHETFFPFKRLCILVIWLSKKFFSLSGCFILFLITLIESGRSLRESLYLKINIIFSIFYHFFWFSSLLFLFIEVEVIYLQCFELERLHFGNLFFSLKVSDKATGFRTKFRYSFISLPLYILEASK